MNYNYNYNCLVFLLLSHGHTLLLQKYILYVFVLKGENTHIDAWVV